MSVSQNKSINISLNLSWKGIIFILQIVLIVLKLGGVISWAWWVVLLPVIIPVVGAILLVALLFFGALVSSDFRAFINDYKSEEEEKKKRTVFSAEENVEIEINGADDEDNNSSR